MTVREQTTEHLIITPAQNLTQPEINLLACMAEGYTTPEQAQAMGLHEEALPLIEGRIRNKLGARTKAHMISRAFLLGVLRPRHLMVLGVAAVIGYSAVIYLDHDRETTELKSIIATEYLGPATSDPRYEQMRAKRGH